MTDYLTVLGYWCHLSCPIKPRRIGHKWDTPNKGLWAVTGTYRSPYQVCFLCGAKRPRKLGGG